MNVYIKILICTIFLYNCVPCSGVHQCWECLSEDCNDPFSSSAASKETCSGQSQYSNFHSDANNKTYNFEKLKHSVLKSYNVSYYNNEYVCIKFVGTSTIGSSVEVTFRRCFPYVSNVDDCQIIRQQAVNENLNIKSCSTCDSDLCNSAIGWKSSLSVTVAAILTLLSFFAINN